MNMNFHCKLPIPMDIKAEYPVTPEMEAAKAKRDAEIKNIFEGSQKGILRYRSYMTKSFSGNYLERYTKALEHYQSKYRSEYDWVDK